MGKIVSLIPIALWAFDHVYPVLAFADPSGSTVEGIRGREQAPTTFGTRRQLLLAKKLFKAGLSQTGDKGLFCL